MYKSQIIICFFVVMGLTLGYKVGIQPYVPLNSLTLKSLYNETDQEVLAPNYYETKSYQESWWDSLQEQKNLIRRMKENRKQIEEITDKFLYYYQIRNNPVSEKKLKLSLIKMLYILSLNSREFQQEEQLINTFFKMLYETNNDSFEDISAIPSDRYQILMNAIDKALNKNNQIVFRNDETILKKEKENRANYKIFSIRTPHDQSIGTTKNSILTTVSTTITTSTTTTSPTTTTTFSITTTPAKSKATKGPKLIPTSTPANYHVTFTNNNKILKTGFNIRDFYKNNQLNYQTTTESIPKDIDVSHERTNHIGLSNDKSLRALKKYGLSNIVSPFLYRKPILSSNQFFERKINYIKSPSLPDRNLTNAFLKASPFMENRQPEIEENYLKINVVKSPFLESYHNRPNGDVIETRIQNYPDVIKSLDPQNPDSSYLSDRISQLLYKQIHSTSKKPPVSQFNPYLKSRHQTISPYQSDLQQTTYQTTKNIFENNNKPSDYHPNKRVSSIFKNTKPTTSTHFHDILFDSRHKEIPIGEDKDLDNRSFSIPLDSQESNTDQRVAVASSNNFQPPSSDIPIQSRSNSNDLPISSLFSSYLQNNKKPTNNRFSLSRMAQISNDNHQGITKESLSNKKSSSNLKILKERNKILTHLIEEAFRNRKKPQFVAFRNNRSQNYHHSAAKSVPLSSSNTKTSKGFTIMAPQTIPQPKTNLRTNFRNTNNHYFNAIHNKYA